MGCRLPTGDGRRVRGQLARTSLTHPATILSKNMPITATFTAQTGSRPIECPIEAASVALPLGEVPIRTFLLRSRSCRAHGRRYETAHLLWPRG